MKKQGLLVAIFLLQLFTILSCQHTQVQPSCISQKMAWDFGSGTIKVKAAEVDICEKKIIKVLYQKGFPISFKQDLDLSADKTFSQQTITAAIEIVKNVQQETQYLRIKKHIGVATAAFREAANAENVISLLNQEHALNIKIISQDDEAQLGIQSASALIGDISKPTLIWDIGGGSQQISILNNGMTTTYKSLWAAVSFKNWVVQNIKNKTSAESPNPLSANEFSLAVKQAKAFSADFKMPPSMPAQITVYGIGGVHSSSLKSRIEKDIYSQEDLIQLSTTSINKTDSEISGKYAATEVTNVALVLGTMQGLNIVSVKPLDAGLIEGLLILEHSF